MVPGSEDAMALINSLQNPEAFKAKVKLLDDKQAQLDADLKTNEDLLQNVKAVRDQNQDLLERAEKFTREAASKEAAVLELKRAQAEMASVLEDRTTKLLKKEEDYNEKLLELGRKETGLKERDELSKRNAEQSRALKEDLLRRLSLVKQAGVDL